MALTRASDEDDVAPGLPGLGDTQLGSVAEDRLATAILFRAAGTAPVAFPLLDLPTITTASSDRGDPGYQGSFRIDPLAEKMRPFAVPTDKLGGTILERLFPK